MSNTLTRERIETEAWFGGQRERVLALAAERDAESELVAALQTELNEARTSYVKAAAERDEAREEQREACARAVVAAGQCEEHRHECELDRATDEAWERVRATPLAATPLWDRIATDALVHAALQRLLEATEAERDEARAELAASKAEPSSSSTPDPSLVYWEGRYIGELADLMAVAERVREACALSLFTCKDHSLSDAIEANISCAKQEDMAKVRATPLSALVKGGRR